MKETLAIFRGRVRGHDFAAKGADQAEPIADGFVEGLIELAAEALSEGRTEDAFEEFDKLGWIKQVPDIDRYKQLSDAYMSAVAEKKKNGEYKSALIVSPTHAEGDRITQVLHCVLLELFG